MRLALVAAVLLTATACGTSSRPSSVVHWPKVAKATRAQWYLSLKKSPTVPVTLSRDEARRALEKAADEAGVRLLETRYDARAGGSAELVVQPNAPARFADGAATRLTPLLRPLERGGHAYLVTVVGKRRPLLMLGWTPGVGGNGGEGIAWQAKGIHSSAVLGRPVMRRSLGDRVMAGPTIP